MKKIRLAHPGEILLKEFIKPNKLSVYRVAKDAGIAQPTLQLIVTGKRPIGAETALRLGAYFAMDAQFWLNLQSEYDLRLAREKLVGLSDIHPFRTAA
jgi:antitoxin HigA-1